MHAEGPFGRTLRARRRQLNIEWLRGCVRPDNCTPRSAGNLRRNFPRRSTPTLRILPVLLGAPSVVRKYCICHARGPVCALRSAAPATRHAPRTPQEPAATKRTGQTLILHLHALAPPWLSCARKAPRLPRETMCEGRDCRRERPTKLLHVLPCCQYNWELLRSLRQDTTNSTSAKNNWPQNALPACYTPIHVCTRKDAPAT